MVHPKLGAYGAFVFFYESSREMSWSWVKSTDAVKVVSYVSFKAAHHDEVGIMG